MQNPPRIVCAAMLMKDGEIIPGVRHFSHEMRKIISKIYGENGHLQVDKQGFIDQYGKFYTREEAWKIARANKQIIRGGYGGGVGPQLDSVPEEALLFSENLY